MSRERRRLQRVLLEKPVQASVPGGAIRLVDVSLTGARAQHEFALNAGRVLRLEFLWNGKRISVDCHVLRCRLERGQLGVTYSSGLRFVDTDDGSRDYLKAMIGEAVTRQLQANRRRYSRLLEPQYLS